jgi:hypothetical protein
MNLFEFANQPGPKPWTTSEPADPAEDDIDLLAPGMGATITLDGQVFEVEQMRRRGVDLLVWLKDGRGIKFTETKLISVEIQ